MFSEGPGGFSTFQLLFALVPLAMLAMSIWGLVSIARRRAAANRITRNGHRVQGKVITSYLGQSGSREHRRTFLVETVEFMTLDGRTVRASPTFSDIGLTDRGGAFVTVVYDPQDPHRFIAPLSGDTLSGRGDGGRIATHVFMAVFAVIFLVASQAMMGIGRSLTGPF